MEKVLVEIANCYGINSFQKEFDFTANKSMHIIYAPNGVMKTSFANVFYDFSKEIESKDLVYPSRVSSRKITNNNGDDLKPESIFVIRPLERTFHSDKLSTLLANEELRAKYTEIHEKIDVEKKYLLDELSKASGIKNNVEEEISASFNVENLLGVLEKISEDTIDEIDETSFPFDQNIYKKIFDEKVVSFLETGDFKNQIQQYIEKYNELISNSAFLSKNFNHYHASTIHKNLNDNGFFKANHTINLNIDGIKTEIHSEKELLKMINIEKEKILKDDSLKNIFNEIDKKISTAQLREFRDYLFDNQQILPELADLVQFRRKIWLSYLKCFTSQYQSLIKEYNKGKEEIKKIIEKARNEKTEWENVVEIFNRRFYVPYILKVTNKEDSILKDKAPSIEYCYKDIDGNIKDVTGDLLSEVLSEGERRALYLLNIIFEIESRKKMGIKTLFIIDDIADSFDYKNKYAIIEYLKEITESDVFFSIILTHNFDFFRTVQDRVMLGNKYTSSYMAIKEKDKIYLASLKYKHISDPFKEWKRNLDDGAKLIATIAFARNIAQHIGDNQLYNKLTSVLHLKKDSQSITIKDLGQIYCNLFKDIDALNLESNHKRVIDLIFEVSDKIVKSESEIGLNLENKIVLSIAIRLNSEIYMIDRINDNAFVSTITKNQTAVLFNKFKERFPDDEESIEILERVNLMTPENIHLNSFMYEPILDISEIHLKQLYEEVERLIAKQELTDTIAGVAAGKEEGYKNR